MVFNSDIFLFAFLPVVFTLFWLSKTKTQRYVLLAVSGFVFYGYWNWRYCFLLLFTSLTSYAIALIIDGTQKRATKRAWLIGSITIDLVILGFFKYYDFFAESMRAVTNSNALPLLHLILPIGISFYTFHTISYIVDVAAGRVKPARNIFEYLTYVSLFSQLVAGPIVRYRQIEEDLEHIDGPPREDNMARGIGFFVIGMIKKVIIADTLARYVDPMLASYQTLSFAGAWVSALGYTFQLYYDFSGYSDMAVGLGAMFGLRIPQNFNAPYKALGIRDFWRRWHISLSTWLRDYLYIPLGGNRFGPIKTHANLLVTMVLGGLWHGANWTFVIWGAYHGILLILDRVVSPWSQRLPMLLHRWATFMLVLIGWVLFRSESFTMARVWLGKMFYPAAISSLATPSSKLLILVVCCFVAVNVLPETWDINFRPRRKWAPVYALGLLLVYLFMNGRDTVFLYYQF